MADELIGTARVAIVGDYSELQSDIDKATQVAAAGGQEIAQALTAGAAGADALSSALGTVAGSAATFEQQLQGLFAEGLNLTQALDQLGADLSKTDMGLDATGAAAAVAAEQMELFDAALHVDYATSAGQLNMFATELEPIGPAATTAAEQTQHFNSAAHDAGEASHGAAGHVHELLGELLEIAGITLSIEALKEFVTEAVNLYATTERAGEGIAFLRGNIKESEEILMKLRETAQGLALPFESVVQAAQKMAFFKLTAEETADAIAVASDAAKASGVSFDSMANSINNIALSGMAMPRTLRQIGIASEDLADVLGVTIGEVKNVFKEMDQSERLQALIEAMGRVKGATEAMADDTVSNLTRMKNTWDFALEDMGSAIAPLAVEGIPTLVLAMKSLVTAGAAVLTGLKLVGDALVGSTTLALESAKAIGTVYVDTITGNFKGAAAAAIEGLDNIKAAAKFSVDSMAADFKAGGDMIDKIWADQAAHSKEAADSEIDDANRSSVAAAAAAKARIASAAELKKQLADVAEFTKSASALWDKIPDSFDEYVQRLADGGQTAKAMLGQVQGDLDKAATLLSKATGDSAKSIQAWVDTLKQGQAGLKAFAAEEAWNKLAVQISTVAKQFPDQLKYLDEATLNFVNDALLAASNLEKFDTAGFVKKLFEAGQKVDEQNKKLEVSYDKLVTHAKILGFEATHAMDQYGNSVLKALPITIDLRDRLGAAFLAVIDLEKEMQSAGITSVASLNAQIDKYQHLLIDMQKLNQPLMLQLDAEQKSLAVEIQRAIVQGQSADALIIKQKNIQLAIQSSTEASRLWGDLYVSVVDDIIKAYDSLGKTLATTLIEGQNFGDTMIKLGKQLAEQILGDLVGTALKALKGALLDLAGVGGKSIGSITGGIGEMKTAIADATKEWGKLTKAITDAGAPSAGGAGGAGGGLSGALNIAGAIGSIVSAISGIIGNVQMHAMNKSLDVIVNHTLRIFNVLDQWYTAAQDWFTQDFTRMGEIWRDMVAGFASVVDALHGGGTRLVPPMPDDTSSYGSSALASIPDVPSMPSVSALGGSTYTSSSKSSLSSIGAVTIHITEAGSPRETARQVAGALKTMSSRFAAYST